MICGIIAQRLSESTAYITKRILEGIEGAYLGLYSPKTLSEFVEAAPPYLESHIIRFSLKPRNVGKLVVLKVILFPNSKNKEENDNKFQWTELQILNDLQEHIFSGACPHFPVVYAAGKKDMRSTFPDGDSDGVMRFMILEHASEGALKDFMESSAELPSRDRPLRSLIFQVIYAIAFMQEHVSGIRHNDIHLDNVLVTCDDLDVDAYAEYVLPSGRRYFVPIYERAVIIDFELARSDRRRPRKMPRYYTTKHGISDFASSKYDLHFFLNALRVHASNLARKYKDTNIENIRDQIISLLGEDLLHDSKYVCKYRLRCRSVHREDDLPFPDPLALLESGWGLFSGFDSLPDGKHIVQTCILA